MLQQSHLLRGNATNRYYFFFDRKQTWFKQATCQCVPKHLFIINDWLFDNVWCQRMPKYTSFLRVIFSITNASVSDSREKRGMCQGKQDVSRGKQDSFLEKRDASYQKQDEGMVTYIWVVLYWLIECLNIVGIMLTYYST